MTRAANMIANIDSNALVELVTAILVLVGIFYNKRDNSAVRRKLEDTTEDRNRRLESIHKLVNGQSLIQKRRIMEYSMRVAELSGSPSDLEIAERAARDYIDCQRVADQK